MRSSHEHDQKQTESQCLQLAIEARKYQRGESRRILDLLAGEIVCRSCEERPDFVRRLASQKNGTDGILLGIEHFRVDHLAIRKRPKKRDNPANAKIASITPVLEKKKQEIFQKWNLLIDENGLLPEEYLESAAQDIFGLAGDYMQGTVNTNYRSLLASLQQKLEGHLKSAPTYRENLKKIALPGEKIQIALLVEVYTEFFSLMKFDNKGIRACKAGNTPLFREVISIIDRIVDKHMVDYVILCLNSSGTGRTPKVYAFRAGNIERQLRKKHLKTYEYLAMDSVFSAFNGRSYRIDDFSFDPISRNAESKEISTTFSCKVEGIEDETFLAAAYYTAWKILTYESQKINFCASMSDFAFAHAIGPEIVRWVNVPGSKWRVEPVWKPSKSEVRSRRINERMDTFKRIHEKEFEQ